MTEKNTRLTARKLDQIAVRIESAAAELLRVASRSSGANTAIGMVTKDAIAVALIAHDVRLGNIVRAARKADALNKDLRGLLTETDDRIAALFAWEGGK